MKSPFSWLKTIFSRGTSSQVLTLLSPPVVQDRPAIVRYAVAGGTVAAMAVLGALALAAFSALMFALAAIYFLATQVLGLKLNVDPAAFYQSMQRQAATYGAN
jgi:hypothetical protein